MKDRADLEQWWPAAQERLRVVMRGRVYAADLDDVIAETALRATTHDEFENESHLVAWAVVVATNLVKDEHRRVTRRAHFAERYVERPNDESVDDVVAELIKRDAMLGRIAELPEPTRAALAGEATANPREQNRARVRKSRALKELRSYYGRLGVAASSLRSGTWARGRGTTEALAGAAAAGLALLGGATLGGLDHSGPTPRVEHSAPITAAARPTVFTGLAADATAPVTSAVGPLFTAPSSTTSTSIDQRFRIPIDYRYDGPAASASVGPDETPPTDDGVMLCQGEPGEPGTKCMYWPDLLMKVVGLLPL